MSVETEIKKSLSVHSGSDNNICKQSVIDIIPHFKAYIDKGLYVFPCKARGKKPAIKTWKENASKDPAVIKAWCKRTAANIGLPTGTKNNIWVLDIDQKSGGLETLEALEAEHGKFNTFTVKTGGGGYHFYFLHHAGIKNSANILAGVDIRGEGGYVIAAGSVHENGTAYEIINDIDPVQAPEWLLKLIEEKKQQPAKKAAGKTTDYGRGVLLNQFDAVKNAAVGNRNSTLNVAAFAVGQYIASGEIEASEGISGLETAGTEAGLGIEEIRKTIKSGINAGRRDPKRRAKDTPEITKDLNLFDEKYKNTDVGNSYRFRDFADKNIKYCFAWNRWFIWDGTRWQQDETGAIITKAKEMITEMYNQVANIDGEQAETKKAAAKHTAKTSAVKNLQAFISLTRNEVPILHDDLDNKPFLVNTKDGTANLKTGTLENQSRDDLLTKRINFGISEHEPYQWIKFLNEIFEKDQQLIKFIQKAVGYSLTGDITEHCLFILFGDGRNGKSTFLNVLGHIFGDYACNTPADTLTIKKHESISNDIARLKGMRFVTAYETENNKQLAEAKIKAMTGGDRQVARFMRAEYFEFDPTYKVWLATNHRPEIRGTDEGIWSRIKLIPFNFRVPDCKMDKHLQGKLMGEAEEILNWAIKGTGLWQSEGLGEPEAVTTATNQYRSDSDIIGFFLKENTEKDLSEHIFKRDLFRYYCTWVELTGGYFLSERLFNKALKEKGFKSGKRGNGGVASWLGIKTKCDDA